MKVYITKHVGLGTFSATFKADEEGIDTSKLPPICLSRNKPGSCNFIIKEIENHGGHSPSFTSAKDRDYYIERVKGDIVEALKSHGYEVDFSTINPPDN